MLNPFSRKRKSSQYPDNTPDQENLYREVNRFLRNTRNKHGAEIHPVKKAQPEAVKQKTDKDDLYQMRSGSAKEKPSRTTAG